MYRKKTLSFGSELLNTILNIPYSGFFPFTLKGPYEFENFSVLDQLKLVKNSSNLEFVELPTVVETSPINSVIHKIIRSNLVPRMGGRSDMTFQDLILSALILSGTKFNFTLFMIKNMESCIKNKTKCLPYGDFITKIFEHFEISFANEEVVHIIDVIDETNLHSSMLKVSVNDMLFWDIVDSTHLIVPSTLPSYNSSISIPVPPSGSKYSKLFQLIQAIDQKLDSVVTTITSLSESVHSLTKNVDTLVVKGDS